MAAPPPPPATLLPYSSMQEPQLPPSSLPSSDPDASWTSERSSSSGHAENAPAATSTPSQTSEKHPKGRRKRTSARDKSILEEAYSKNDKPDKQARLEIVKRVELNEKEVQIWFQNRRQNDRRRSRPLSQQEIQEIAALQYSARHAIPPPECLAGLTPGQLRPISNASTAPQLTNSTASSSSPSSHNDASPPARSHFALIQNTPVSAPGREGLARDVPEATPNQNGPSPSQEAQSGPHSWSNSMLSSSVSSSGSIGYFANRRNLGSSFSTPSTIGRDDSLKLEPFVQPTCSPETSIISNQSQSHSQSSVRLSLSLEGKAELISASPTPNPPPRPSSTPVLPHQRHRIFERSHSDLDDLRLPPIKGLEESRPPRLLRVRSRDVQAWESIADPNAQDQLTAQAEHESNGSAIAAINLLRSSSGVLQSNMSKRNAPMAYKPNQAKRAKISRAASSIARFETSKPDEIVEEKEKVAEKESSGKITISRLLSPTDSDKENWSPGEDGNPDESRRRRPAPVNTDPIKSQTLNGRRRPLQAGLKTPTFLNSRAYTAPARHRGADEGIEIFEDSPASTKAARGDSTIERFMRGAEVSPSKKPDMDCAAGLLSLARGGWAGRP